MASTYLQRTPSSTGNRDKWTWSAWVKRSKLGANITLFSAWADSNNNSVITFLDDDALRYYDKAAGSVQANLYTNRKFIDTSSWYHIVVVYDSGNNTSGDRVKIYVNGVEETSFSTDTMPGQNNDSTVNKASCPHYIGTDDTTGYFFDGYMTHVHFCDGYAYSASDFGETDTTTGEWKAKTSPSVTYGTNGFLILKDGNTITDQSSNSNNFTLGGGTLTDLKDNPDNVFATMNALSKGSLVLSLGNTKARNDQSGVDANVLGTIALGNGKYYWETYKHGGGNTGIGLTLASIDGSNHSAVHSYRVNYYADGYIYQNGFGLSDINTGVTYGDTDIIGVSVDTENGIIKFYKNGVLVNNSSQTNAVFTYAQNELIPFWYCNNGGEWRVNFGNGYFGTTAITTNSGNGYSGAEGSSKFNYTVPTGYSALSTKGLNE